jgi:hypothetical protein
MIRKRLVTVITALVLIAALGFPLLSPTVALADIGDITEPVIDIFEFETVKCKTPNIIHVSGDVYAIAYEGESGQVTTVEIEADGGITESVIDTFEFETVKCKTPNIIHVSGDVYAIAYSGDKDDGYLKTVEIEADGDITEPVIDTFEFDPDKGKTPDIIHVSGDVYAIAYSGDKDDGYLKTVEITTTGDITEPVIDTFEFDTVMGKTPDIIHVSGNVYTIAYEGESGQVTTVEITTTGDITEPVIARFARRKVRG